MTRVLIPTRRCRCHTSCRKSRFSGVGAQIRGKSSFSISFRICSASRLLLSHLLGSDLRRIADPYFIIELRQQALEPARVSGGLYSHAYLFPQLAIELFSLSAMRQPPFSAFSCFRVHPSDLLHARVIIASYFVPRNKIGFMCRSQLCAVPPVKRSGAWGAHVQRAT